MAFMAALPAVAGTAARFGGRALAMNAIGKIGSGGKTDDNGTTQPDKPDAAAGARSASTAYSSLLQAGQFH